MAAHTFTRALRMARRRPVLSLTVVAIIAIGIGSTSAVFSVVDASLLRPPPYRDAPHLVELWNRDADGSAWPRLEPERAQAWLNKTDLLTRVERYTDRTMLLAGVADPEDLRVTTVSAGLFDMLGVSMTRGRGFAPDEYATGAAPVVVVSDAFWRRHFGGEPMAKAETILLDDQRYDVIGVTPAWFRFPHGNGSVWRPLRPEESGADAPLNYVARLADDVTRANATARFDVYGKQLAQAVPRKDGWQVYPAFLIEPDISQELRTAIWVLLGAVACVMLMVCLNATNLLLVQATTRQREFGIQQALGATPGRLARQVFVEGALYAGVAAVLGVAVARWSLELMLTLAPRELARFGNGAPAIDARALAFAVGLASITALVSTMGPALHAARARGHLVTAGEDRTQTGGRRLQHLRAGLIVAELSLSLVLLAGAGLFIQSLRHLLRVDPGFDVEHVVAAQFGVPSIRYATADARAGLLDRLAESLRGVPGVAGVSFSSGLPPRADITFGSRLEAEGAVAPARTGDIVLPFAEVDTAFFSTLGVRLLRGRGFDEADVSADASRSVVVGRAFADLLWPGEDPIGRRYRISADGAWRTVVGVVANVKLMGPDDRSYPYAVFYPRPRLGRATRTVALAVRTAGDPGASISAMRRAIREVDSEIPISEMASGTERFATSMDRTRFVLTLLTVFASIALALAVAGTYGVVSYAVAQRTREIGIRIALGASEPSIQRAVLAQGSALALTGVAAGLLIFAGASRFIAPQLFGIAPRDPGVLWVASLFVILTTLAGVLVPARRASRVSPVIAMLPE